MGPASADYARILANIPGSAAPWFTARALPYLWEAGLETGVDPVVLVSQCGLETGWGRFGGVIDESFNNPCGLKSAVGGADDDPAAHARFSDLRTGAQAHACHLLAYATEGALPAWNPDPRAELVQRGSATTVQALGGKWAPDPEYGNDIAAIVRRLRGN